MSKKIQDPQEVVTNTLNQIQTHSTARAISKVVIDPELVRGYLRYYYKMNVENTLRALRIDEPTREIIERSLRWLTLPNAKPCLLLRGDVGNGKTTLANSICQTYGELARKIPITITADHIVDLYSDKVTQPEQLENREKLKLITGARFLFIDDIGKEAEVVKSWGNEVHPIEKIIRYRYENRVEKRFNTILTTNLSNEEIKTRYGKYVLDRISETYNHIVFDHPSYRQK